VDWMPHDLVKITKYHDITMTSGSSSSV